MLVYRLLHAKDRIKDVDTNIDGRAWELTGPQICLFSTDTLSKNKSALKEILPVLSSFLRQKGEMSSRTLEAVIYTVLRDLFAGTNSCSSHEAKNDDGNTQTYCKIENGELCESVRKDIGGENIPGKRAFLSTEVDKATHNRILKRCRDIFGAKDDWTGSGNDKTRALRFDKEIVLKVGSTFEIIPEIKILDNDDNSDVKDDQTIWKDWDRSDGSEYRASDDLAEDRVDTTSTSSNTAAASDNYNPLVSTTAADTSILNKATRSEVVGKGTASTTMTPTDAASIPAASTTSTVDANKNLGTTGQLYTHLEDIQDSKSTKPEDHTKRVAENVDSYSTTYAPEFPNKLEKNSVEDVNIVDNKSSPGFGSLSTKTHMQNDLIYPPREQKVVPLSQSNISGQERQIEDEEKSHEAAVGKAIYSKSKTKTQDLGLPAIPCIFCYSYRTPIEFDLGNHLLESHRMDLVKLPIGKCNMEYRITHAIQLCKKEKAICNDNANRGDYEEDEEDDNNNDRW